VRLVGITSATKGALDNKVTVDIQMITTANLMAMASRYDVVRNKALLCMQVWRLAFSAT